MIEDNTCVSSLSRLSLCLKHAVAPDFSASQYFTTEGGQQAIRLSASILTNPAIPAFNGSIEVDITAEDQPGSNSAEFGKYMIMTLHFAFLCKTHFCICMITYVFRLPLTNSLLQLTQMPCHLIYTGRDYVLNLQNPLSTIFTVAFQPRQANSTEHSIFLSEDNTFEGPESFRLKIFDARFIGEAADIFRVQEGLTNTIAVVNIEDSDCEFRMSA